MAQLATTEIWRAANMMIELYGPEATIRATIRADALLEQGDTDGSWPGEPSCVPLVLAGAGRR